MPLTIKEINSSGSKLTDRCNLCCKPLLYCTCNDDDNRDIKIPLAMLHVSPHHDSTPAGESTGIWMHSNISPQNFYPYLDAYYPGWTDATLTREFSR